MCFSQVKNAENGRRFVHRHCHPSIPKITTLHWKVHDVDGSFPQ